MTIIQALVDGMFGQTKEALRIRGQTVFVTHHQQPSASKGLVKSTSDLLLERLQKIGVDQVAAKDQMVAHNGGVPDQVMFKPIDPF